MSLAQRLQSVQADIVDAARASGRSPDEITTIVVTKFHPASMVRELYDLGVRNVGENRHQEAEAKSAELAGLEGLTWHFIGQLQSNKAKAVRTYASVVHSVDSTKLVRMLAQADPGPVPVLDCFVQLNLTDDPVRGGVTSDQAMELAERVAAESSLNLLGVMAVAPLDEDPRPAFARVREVSERIRTIVPAAGFISAGMSYDFAEAIAEGATHLRIGSAITGERPFPR